MGEADEKRREEQEVQMTGDSCDVAPSATQQDGDAVANADTPANMGTAESPVKAPVRQAKSKLKARPPPQLSSVAASPARDSPPPAPEPTEAPISPAKDSPPPVKAKVKEKKKRKKKDKKHAGPSRKSCS